MLNEIEEILSPIYMVGGAVRDCLLGIEPKDYDFATPLHPNDIEICIRKSGMKPYVQGKKYGTIGFNFKGHLIEISTFRIEEYKKNYRKPVVIFVNDVIDDLSRRDFTINAIAQQKDKYIDPFKGQLDLKEKIIRCVGSPKQRFKEDPLRMLRAARLAAQLEFTIDVNLESTVKTMSHKILNVSIERCVEELDKMLVTKKPDIGLDFMARTRLLNFIIPELSLQINYNQNTPYHSLNLWEHTKKVVELSSAKIETRWAALLHDIAKPFVMTTKNNKNHYIKHELLGKEMVVKIAKYFKWSNERRKLVSDLVLNHLEVNNPLKNVDDRAK